MIQLLDEDRHLDENRRLRQLHEEQMRILNEEHEAREAEKAAAWEKERKARADSPERTLSIMREKWIRQEREGRTRAGTLMIECCPFWFLLCGSGEVITWVQTRFLGKEEAKIPSTILVNENCWRFCLFNEDLSAVPGVCEIEVKFELAVIDVTGVPETIDNPLRMYLIPAKAPKNPTLHNIPLDYRLLTPRAVSCLSDTKNELLK